MNLTRGYETNQRNLTGNADITLSNTTFLSVKVGHFYDNYADTGVPMTTPSYYNAVRGRSPSCPSAVRGTTTDPEHSCRSNHRP